MQPINDEYKLAPFGSPLAPRLQMNGDCRLGQDKIKEFISHWENRPINAHTTNGFFSGRKLRTRPHQHQHLLFRSSHCVTSQEVMLRIESPVSIWTLQQCTYDLGGNGVLQPRMCIIFHAWRILHTRQFFLMLDGCMGRGDRFVLAWLAFEP